MQSKLYKKVQPVNNREILQQHTNVLFKSLRVALTPGVNILWFGCHMAVGKRQKMQFSGIHF